MSEKNLKITVKSDLKEGNKLTSFVMSLQKEVQKLQKAISGINLGGGQPGPDGKPRPGQRTLDKQAADSKKAMESMGREVQNLTRQYKSLNEQFDITSARLQLAQQQIVKFNKAASGSGVSNLSGGGGGGISGTGGGRPPDWTSRAANALTSPVGGSLGRMMQLASWGLVAANVKEAILGAPQFKVDADSLALSNLAAGNAKLGGLGSRMLGGDIMPSVGLARMMKNVGGGSGRTMMANINEIISESDNVAISKAIGMGLNLNVVKGIRDTYKAADPSSRTAVAKNLAGSLIELGIAADPMENALYQYSAAQASGRVGFARRYGGDFNAASALGARIDPQQVMSTVGAILDVLGQGVQRSKITKLVVEATRMGISPDATRAMLVAQEMGGGDILGHVLRSGMSRPMMGRAGAAAAAFAQNSLMPLGDVGVGGFIGGGTNANELDIRRREAGIGLLNQITTGGLDPYQMSINAASSIKPGRSVYVASTLMNMPLQELAKAALQGPTDEQKRAGITQQNASETFNSEFNSLRSRAVQETGLSSAAGMRSEGIQALINAGPDVIGALKNGAIDPTNLGVGISQVTGQPLGTGTGAVNWLMDAMKPSGSGQAPGETSGLFTNALAGQMAGPQLMEKQWERIKVTMDDLNGPLQTFGETISTLRGSMSDAQPEEFQKSFTSLAGLGNAMNAIAKDGPAAVNVLDHVRNFVVEMAGIDLIRMGSGTDIWSAGGRKAASDAAMKTPVIGPVKAAYNLIFGNPGIK